ncbi:TlpA family protein disulfide reductase [Actinomadura alba]|uniref:TlpA family protein disulfide reductase n=2 Tax=Actinomadura alba TaxID=406431 RepID=A0ABR7LXD1_9ACTN|nr:TlpA family protein disulfide reductase [Actinomadura alba]
MAGATFLGAGCAEGGSDPAMHTRAASSVPADTGERPGDRAAGRRLRSLPPELRFEGRTLDGRPFTGSNLAERPVVFWFWAPWCPNCVAEAPHVAAVVRKYGDRVAFVGVAGLGDNRNQMRHFVARTGVGTGDMPQLDDSTGRLFAHFRVSSVPSFVFMTLDGTATRESGQLGQAGLEQRVRAIATGR